MSVLGDTWAAAVLLQLARAAAAAAAAAAVVPAEAAADRRPGAKLADCAMVALPVTAERAAGFTCQV
jgi:hypothetical protein